MNYSQKMMFKVSVLCFLFLCVSAFSVSAQTESGEDLVYIQQAQYQQEMSYKQAANPADNHAVVEQRGNRHVAELQQYGSGLNGTVIQRGSRQTAYLRQEGSGIQAAISQHGSRHKASLVQEGNDLEATIEQNGSFQEQEITQLGNGHRITVYQSGGKEAGSTPFSYSQTGEEPSRLIITLEGNAPPVNITQY